MYHGGAIDMGSVEIVLSINQKRLQKRLIPGLDQVSYFRNLGRGVSRSGKTMQSSAGLGSVPIIQPFHNINLGR